MTDNTCVRCHRPMLRAGLCCDVCLQGGSGRPDGHGAAGTTPSRPTGRTAAANAQSEEQVQAEIVRYLELHGWAVWKTSSHRHAKGVDKGVPDLIAIGPDRLAFIEVKRPGGRVRPEQRDFLAAAAAAGVACLIAYGIEDVRTLCEQRVA